MTETTAQAESVMLGHGYYSSHSQAQRAAAGVGVSWFAAAAAAVPLPRSPTPLMVGDFGCAGGANEMGPVAAALDAIRLRSAELPVEVVHTDLPGNDFGPLFELLAGPGGYPAGRRHIHPYVVGRTLYGPLVPEGRLHLGWSAITLHWLSSMPVTVPDAVYSGLLPDGPARQALRERAARDWSTFLAERARELVDGGELVLVGGASEADGHSGAEGVFTMIGDELATLVDGGLLRRREFDDVFYPTWNRTPAEWLDPLGDGAFEVLDSTLSVTDDADTYGGTGDGAAFATAYLPFLRAITERPFFRWLEPDRTPAQREEVVETFYRGMRDRIARHPQRAACQWHTMTLRLRRRPRR